MTWLETIFSEKGILTSDQWIPYTSSQTLREKPAWLIIGGNDSMIHPTTER